MNMNLYFGGISPPNEANMGMGQKATSMRPYLAGSCWFNIRLQTI